MEGNQWQDALNQFKQEQGGGRFFYLKSGKTRMRLVPEPGTEKDPRPKFYEQTVGVYQGSEKKKYVLSAIVAGAENREIPDEMKTKVQAVVVAPSVVSDILAILADGYDLLGPNGHGITVNRQGSGFGTSYTVIPSRDPIPLPEGTEWMEDPSTLAEAADSYEAFQRNRSGGSNSGAGAGAAAPAQTAAPEDKGGW